MRRSPSRRLIGSLLACAIAAGGFSAGPAPAQPGPAPPPAMAPRASPEAKPAPAAETLRLTRNVPGDSKPLMVTADEITAWTEGGHTFIFLRGQVLLQQSVIQTRFNFGVLRVDAERYRRTGVWHVDLYAEGNVHLDSSDEVRSAPKAVLEFNTRGEIKLNSQQSKVNKRPMAEDPLVVRGRAEWPAVAAPVARTPGVTMPALQQTSVNEPLAPPAPFLPGGMSPPQGGPPTAMPTAPPQTPVPVPPPKGPAPQPVLPGPRGAAAPAPPGPVTRVACYQPPGAMPTPDAGAAPPALAPLPRLEPGAVSGAVTPPGARRAMEYSVQTRSGQFDIQSKDLGNGEQQTVISGGIILQVKDVPGIGLLDMEADQLVIWSKGGSPQQLLKGGIQTGDGTGATYEFYLKGNVEIRRRNVRDSQTLRADEVYYDVNRKVAVALSATLEMRVNPLPGKPPLLMDPVYFRTDELLQLSETQFRVVRSEVYSSKLPSDPGLKVYVTDATVDENVVPRKSVFGRPVLNRVTGEVEEDRETIFHGRNVFFELENVPFFYLPYLAGNANDPLGPVKSITVGYNSIYGFDVGASLDVYQLLGIQKYDNTKWRLDLDYLSYRGPVAGTEFDYAGKELFGVPATYEGFFKAYGIYDRGFDVLGGPRPVNDFSPDSFRGRFTWRQNIYGLPDGFTVQSQFSALSDRNYLEAYFKNEFDNDINQETFLYVKQQQDFWAWTARVEPNIRNWVTETQALPEVNGYLLGLSLFDRITSNTRASAGYYNLHITSDPENPVSPTDQADSTGRFDFWQEFALPFAAGPVKIVPYTQFAGTGYTNDLEGDPLGRAWGGVGVRASMPLTRIYPDVTSELFNLQGINHKVVLSANYFNASETESYSKLPQLDRLNDDATDQALRDIKPLEPVFNPANGSPLVNSPLYDPQLYAIRRLVDNRIDSRDTIEVLQLDIRQRLQTKRGYPGFEHIVDWMTLDLSASYFPASTRDNFGEKFSFLQYDYVWNVGDRTALVSTGWVDPGTDGARVFTFGAYFNRPDRTNFYIGYREIEPVDSKAVTGAVTYIFSPKYALTASSTYDFGTNQSLSNSLVVTRIGTDLSVSLGVTYNALTQNFGAVFEVVPNIVPVKGLGTTGASPNAFLR